MIIIFFLIASLACYECVYVYSSFWAPLFDPRILNYQVDIKYDPDGGKKAQEDFKNNYGYRGEQLIADLGNGKGPRRNEDNKEYGDVKLHYTYK